MNDIDVVKKVFPEVQVMLPSDRYKYLVDDLRSILVQRIKNSRFEVLQAKWEIGERIQDEMTLQGKSEYKDLIAQLSTDLATSGTELYRCVEFHTKFPVWEDMLAKIPEGDNLSWNIIKTKYLPDVPTANIPLIVPKIEMHDTFGLIKWWVANDSGKFILILKNKEGTVKLQVSRVKDVEATPLKETFTEIDEYYIALKRWNKKDLDHYDYSRINKSVKRLLFKCGDKEKIKRAIAWCHNKYSKDGIDWSMETVVKKWPEAVRDTGAHDKHVRRLG